MLAPSGGEALRGERVVLDPLGGFARGDRQRQAAAVCRQEPLAAGGAGRVAVGISGKGAGPDFGGDRCAAAAGSRDAHHGQLCQSLLEAAWRNFQKKTLRAAEQDRLDVAQARQGWKASQASLDRERLVFVDETGTSTKMVRTHGRCRRGRRLIGKAPWGHLKTTTFTAGLRRDGLVAPWVLDGPMNGEAFLTYVKERTGFQPRRDRQFARSQSRWGPRCDRGQERNTALPASLFARP
jgi:hypothetical protein